jgi:hypothetical protein
MAQPNGAPSSCTTTFLSNTATGYLQATDLVDQVTASLTLPPDLVKGIPDILHAILDPLVGEDAPKAWGVPPDVVKHLVSAGKTTPAGEADERGEHAASEDSSMQPFASQPGASAPPAAGRQDAPVPLSHPPAGFPSGLVRRQGAEAGYGGSEGNSTNSTVPAPPSPVSGNSTAPASDPLAPSPSASDGGDVGGSVCEDGGVGDGESAGADGCADGDVDGSEPTNDDAGTSVGGSDGADVISGGGGGCASSPYCRTRCTVGCSG